MRDIYVFLGGFGPPLGQCGLTRGLWGPKVFEYPNYGRLKSMVLTLTFSTYLTPTPLYICVSPAPPVCILFYTSILPLYMDADISPIPRSREENQERYVVSN